MPPDRASRNWDSFKNEESGGTAMAAARFNSALKDAGSGGGGFGGGGAAGVESLRALGVAPGVATAATPAEEPAGRVAQYAQQGQGRFAGGRNFFQNGSLWVDSLVQKQSNARHERIQFGSPEYFALATNQPGVLPWLALGQNVQFVLEGTIYEIYE